jgi:hypothetical protein
MVFTQKTGRAGIILACAVLVSFIAPPAAAQDRRAVVYGRIGGATIGHADSEQGKAPIFGGGAAFHLTQRFVVEGDVHRGRVEQVFGREHHDFSQVTFTGSLLFRSSPDARAHFVAGGGWALQRAHTEFNEAPFGRVDRVEIVRLLHGTIGADWDLSSRLVLRTEGVLWFGEGLDWVVGGRAGLGYRF